MQTSLTNVFLFFNHPVVTFHHMWLLASTVSFTSSWQSEYILDDTVKKKKSKSLIGCQTLLLYKQQNETQSSVKWLENKTAGQETHFTLQEAAWCHLPSTLMFLAPARVFLRFLITHRGRGGCQQLESSGGFKNMFHDAKPLWHGERGERIGWTLSRVFPKPPQQQQRVKGTPCSNCDSWKECKFM